MRSRLKNCGAYSYHFGGESTGRDIAATSTPDIARAGIAYVPEAMGIFSDLTVRENIILAVQAERGWARPMSRKEQDAIVEQYIDQFHVRPADPERMIKNLSGGNQQKVLLGRWLATKPELLILDEPTRGIDVGAKAQIQKLVAGLSEKGMAVIFISAELEEVLRLSHRIGILRDRRMVDEIVNSESTTVEEVVDTTFEVTLEAGEYEYVCDPHPPMTGSFTVT